MEEKKTRGVVVMVRRGGTGVAVVAAVSGGVKTHRTVLGLNLRWASISGGRADVGGDRRTR